MNAATLLLISVLTPSPVPAASEPQQALVRVAEQQRFDADDWRHRLSASDLDERERAFEALVDRAVEDEAARKALQEWSRDAQRPDLAWTARLALREVERRPGTHLRALRDFGGGAMGDLRQRFQELERRFGGLDSMFGDLQRDLERAFQSPPAGGAGARSQTKSYTLEIEPGHAKVEVHEDVDGQRTSRSYTGSSLDEILEQHPELREALGAGGGVPGFSWRGGNGALRGPALRSGPQGLFRIDPRAADEDDRWDRPAPPLAPGGVRTDILGISCSPPSADERARLGLDGEVGLKVERTEPGTIAAAVGVRPGDVVVALNGRALSGREDVATVLRERKPGEEVRVELVDERGKRHTLTWRE